MYRVLETTRCSKLNSALLSVICEKVPLRELDPWMMPKELSPELRLRPLLAFTSTSSVPFRLTLAACR
ncbi:hypothetical protein D3C71_2131270 [compost metagenome]